MIRRRELLGLAVAATALAACGGDDDDGRTTTTDARSEGDIAVLNALLELEHLAVAAYASGARLLGGEARSAAGVLGAQEQEHADGLAQAIRDLGGRPPRPQPAREYARMFEDLRSEEDVLRYVADLENTAVAAYLDALPKLASPELRGTAAAILTTEAEHISVLLGVQGEPQAPEPFVTGDAA